MTTTEELKSTKILDLSEIQNTNRTVNIKAKAGMIQKMTHAAALLAAGAIFAVDPTLSAAAARDVVATPDLRLRFDRWLAAHGKSYNERERRANEYSRRLSVFASNADIVRRHNEAHQAGLTSYMMSMDGPFADVTDEEFSGGLGGLMTPQNCSATHVSSGPVPRASPRCVH